MEYKEIIIGVGIAIGIIVVKTLETVLNFIKSWFGKRNLCNDDSQDPATKGDIHIVKLEILKEVDETRASKAEVQEMRGKLDEISHTTNSMNTAVAVMAERMTTLQNSIEALFKKKTGG